MSGLVLVASRTFTVADPGNLLAWMSDEVDARATVEEERLTRLKLRRIKENRERQESFGLTRQNRQTGDQAEGRSVSLKRTQQTDLDL